MSTPSRRRHLVAMASFVAVAGCSMPGESGASNDCESQVRADDIVYTRVIDTDREATRFATAEVAECDDVGPDPEGSVFPEHPQLVQTWEFAGYSTDDVVGVRAGADTINVFIADSVPLTERDRLIEELSDTTG